MSVREFIHPDWFALARWRERRLLDRELDGRRRDGRSEGERAAARGDRSRCHSCGAGLQGGGLCWSCGAIRISMEQS